MRVSDLTTIKIPIQGRDRFAAAAEVHGITMRALLDQLSRQVADAALMEQAAQQMCRLSAGRFGSRLSTLSARANKAAPAPFS